MWMVLLLACNGPDADSGAEDTCATDTGSSLDPSCPCDAPAVEVGGGDIDFVPLSDGDPLTMVHGPQGGWHVLGSARMTNLAPIVAIHYTVDVLSLDARVSDQNLRVQMISDSACTGYYPGIYGYLDVTALASGEADTPPELLAGDELLLTMEVTDLDGRVGVGTLHGVATLDPMDQ
jgi:hypothetical protein